MLVAIIPSLKPAHILDETVGKSLKDNFPIARVIYTTEKTIFDSFAVTCPIWQEKYKYKPDKTDTIIFCHDDIEILTNKIHNINCLNALEQNKIGFVGVAGTSILDNQAIWWKATVGQSLHGIVYHQAPGKQRFVTMFGPNDHEPVAALDGVFLASKYSTLLNLELKKPAGYAGDWDFYDIFYTSQATIKGYSNLVVPIILNHTSLGVPRQGWYSNRAEFINNTKLPLLRNYFKGLL